MPTQCYHDVHTMIHIEIFKNMLYDVCFKNIVVHRCSIVVASWRHRGIVVCVTAIVVTNIYHVSFPNGIVYLPSTVPIVALVLIMEVVLYYWAIYTLLFEKVMHFCTCKYMYLCFSYYGL